MPGWLSTHVLDTASGKPAAGVPIQLWRLDGAERHLLRETVTNPDGRTDQPLLEPLARGTYELVFGMGVYFGQDGFLTEVPVRFAVTDASQHYHVPLLVSPWSYTTYRGS